MPKDRDLNSLTWLSNFFIIWISTSHHSLFYCTLASGQAVSCLRVSALSVCLHEISLPQIFSRWAFLCFLGLCLNDTFLRHDFADQTKVAASRSQSFKPIINISGRFTLCEIFLILSVYWLFFIFIYKNKLHYIPSV